MFSSHGSTKEIICSSFMRFVVMLRCISQSLCKWGSKQAIIIKRSAFLEKSIQVVDISCSLGLLLGFVPKFGRLIWPLSCDNSQVASENCFVGVPT